MRISIKELKDKAMALLVNGGLPSAEAHEVVTHLLEEELLGESSHGFYRLDKILSSLLDINVSESRLKVSKINQNVSSVIAQGKLGLVTAAFATDIAIEQANENGTAFVSATGYIGTTGALGYYTRRIAKNNLIGIVMCTSEYAVAPWGGKDAILGTNPIAFSFPDGDSSIVADFATAAMTYGELMLKARAGETVPLGYVLDKDGRPSTDPMDADNGCQLPMAGHKGFALGLAIEILAGLFIGAKAGKDAVQGSDGILIISLKPDLFVSRDLFSSHLSALKSEILNSAPAFESSIRLPGIEAIERIKTGISNGYCDIPDAVYSEIEKRWRNYNRPLAQLSIKV